MRGMVCSKVHYSTLLHIQGRSNLSSRVCLKDSFTMPLLVLSGITANTLRTAHTVVGNVILKRSSDASQLSSHILISAERSHLPRSRSCGRSTPLYSDFGPHSRHGRGTHNGGG